MDFDGKWFISCLEVLRMLIYSIFPVLGCHRVAKSSSLPSDESNAGTTTGC